jgi:TolB-like protein
MVATPLVAVFATVVLWMSQWHAEVQPKGFQQSVAVLGFKSDGQAPGAEELATGLATDIVYELARNADLRVVSELSSFPVGSAGLTAPEVGQRLRSRYLVDGVARRSGDMLLLRVQLVDTKDGRIVWSERYETGADGLAKMRDSLAQKIAGTVHTSLRQKEAIEALARSPATLDAYSRVWRAVALKHRYQPDATREAQRLLTEVTTQDPLYAPAWAYLGMVNALDAFFRLSGEWTAARADEIIDQAERAIALDPRLPAAHVALADGQWLAGRYRDALLAGQRCAELGPSDTYCLQALASMQLGSGDVQGALKTIERALELSPVAPPWLTATHADILWALRRYEDALQEALLCRQALPAQSACGRIIISSLVESGRASEARERMAPFLAKFPNHTTREWRVFPAPGASELQARVLAAARAAGVPDPDAATPPPPAKNP